MCKAFIDNDQYDLIRDPRNSVQIRKALDLAFKLNFNIDEQIGFSEIKKVEAYLKDYQIMVINYQHFSINTIFVTSV